METIDRQQVLSRIEKEPDIPIVDVLPTKMFDDYHLPGAINVPVDDEDFDALIQRAVPDKGSPVIVYCYDEDCDASPTAAKRMEELGYRNVLDYEGGKEDWKEAGLQVVS